MATAKGSKQPKPTRSMAPIEVGFGVVLIVLGAFVLAAVSNPLEIAVWAGGPILAVAGIVVAVLALVRRSGSAPLVFGFVAFFLGSLLAIHDFLFPPGIAVLVHLGIGVAIVILGILQLVSKKRYYARWFAKGPPQPLG
ncbi:MAG: hypothetical protein AABY18_01080 [Candidatus Thermoplasmatota archaeon]